MKSIAKYETKSHKILRLTNAGLLMIILLFLIAGCSLINTTPAELKKKQTSIENRMKSEDSVPKPIRTEGSLWDLSNDGYSLVTDSKARAIGDVVLINIIESANAEKVAATKLKRDAKVHAALQNLLGSEKYFKKTDETTPSSNYLKGMDPENLVQAEAASQFDADTSTKRSGKLTARISAIVTDVFPNGNIKVSGSQVIKVNNENQILSVEGIIRPQDVEPDNSIDSPLIADSRIEYSGKGVLGDKQRPGFLMRILDLVWPF